MPKSQLPLPHVAVILVSYNTAKLTQQALQAIFASQGVKLCVYVVDNASSDRTLGMLKRTFGIKNSKTQWKSFQEKLHTRVAREQFPNVKVDVTAVPEIWSTSVGEHELYVLLSQRNLGFGRANNVAAAWANTDYVFFLNSDTEIDPLAMKNLVAEMEKERKPRLGAVLARMQNRLDMIGIMAAQLYNTDGSLQRQGGALPTLWNIIGWISFADDIPLLNRISRSYQHHDEDIRAVQQKGVMKVGWVGGTAMMVKSACLHEIGGFDSEIFMYGEDVELCWRAHQRHWDVAMCASAKVMHIGSASSGQKNALLGEIQGLLYMWQKHRSQGEVWLLRWVLKLGIMLRIQIFGILRRYGQQRIYQEALELVR